MINKLMKGLVDLLYGVKRVQKQFESNNPSETIYVANGSKGIMTSGNQDIKRGIDWIASQRAVILLTNKRIICGKWSIPLDNISEVKLLKVNSLLGAGQILKVSTKDNDNYQFGMQVNPEWIHQKILPLTVEKGKIKYSIFSIALRLFLVVYFIYWLIEKFGRS